MKPDEILQTCLDLVTGERASQHGDYTTMHERFAELVTVYLGHNVTPEQAAFIMVLLKVARHENGAFNPDDGVDATAYTAIWAALCDGR
mgnify:FL=1|tara:strand:- start:1271 stop:1537 length:267 start_codon:yes stop_codon:yes gene_type:complete